jgi:hypothetical protein
VRSAAKALLFNIGWARDYVMRTVPPQSLRQMKFWKGGVVQGYLSTAAADLAAVRAITAELPFAEEIFAAHNGVARVLGFAMRDV